jgi:hypothetical protein
MRALLFGVKSKFIGNRGDAVRSGESKNTGKALWELKSGVDSNRIKDRFKRGAV